MAAARPPCSANDRMDAAAARIWPCLIVPRSAVNAVVVPVQPRNGHGSTQSRSLARGSYENAVFYGSAVVTRRVCSLAMRLSLQLRAPVPYSSTQMDSLWQTRHRLGCPVASVLQLGKFLLMQACSWQRYCACSSQQAQERPGCIPAEHPHLLCRAPCLNCCHRSVQRLANVCLHFGPCTMPCNVSRPW